MIIEMMSNNETGVKPGAREGKQFLLLIRHVYVKLCSVLVYHA
jgi:hypothetical protein